MFSKTANNFVEHNVENADPLAFLQIVTSCNLFPRQLFRHAYAVVRIRNFYSHAAVYKTNEKSLNGLFRIFDSVEKLLIHQSMEMTKETMQHIDKQNIVYTATLELV